MIMHRPELDNYFMEIARVVASRSTCLRRRAGAVLVKDKRILSTGYNGVPKGLPHCEEKGCPRALCPSGTHHELCRAVHSEQNAIIQAAIHGVSIEGATLYCTHQPCTLCAKMLINAGIRRVVYHLDYPDSGSLEFFKLAHIEIHQIE
jgi:dCMP deaminase